jgi:catechol 2,3-dioxygenase-like lactoylglutathione lyase family enzyme
VKADAFISFLPSEDLDRSADFYERVLGLSLTVDQGACRIYRVTDTAFLGVCLREPFEGPAGAVTTIVADDVDGWCERILAEGWAVRSGPQFSETYKIYHAYVDDPDGNLLEIQRFDDPNWRGLDT